MLVGGWSGGSVSRSTGAMKQGSRGTITHCRRRRRHRQQCSNVPCCIRIAVPLLMHVCRARQQAAARPAQCGQRPHLPHSALSATAACMVNLDNDASSLASPACKMAPPRTPMPRIYRGWAQ